MAMRIGTENLEIKVLIFKDQNLYIAQCLEYDLAVQAEGLEDLRENFALELALQIENDIQNGEEPLSTLPETPRVFWEMYQRANPLQNPIDIKVPTELNSRINQYLPKKTSWALSEAPCE